ncbi:MAG: histidinol dehydrogenase [Ruminococcaceae bacterium]|nr:histidinol dehydrogenase [Oscillospiraceae bacterium]
MVDIIKADGVAERNLLDQLRQRSGEENRRVTEIVSAIIDRVCEEGDEAVKQYTATFDCPNPEYYEVPMQVVEEAHKNCDAEFIEALKRAAESIADFHKRQLQQSWLETKNNGVILGQRIRGLKRVGVYVPGGTAAYPSSVLMNVIPAKIAGVEEIIMVTPPGKDGRANPDILAAAAIAGVSRVFLMGGAQAVAALAYGTQLVPRVDKIVGPGNIYVATAKRLVYGQVDIDMIAGPSEILVVADSSAKPAYLAADMMSQAEHDRLASSILLTTDEEIAIKTKEEIERQSKELSRRDIIVDSLRDYGAIVICRSLDEAIDLANELAPEHLEMCVENPMEYIGRMDNAGSVFLGDYSPEPLGDYYAGPNHVLPTSGTARFFSPLSVDSFLKKSSFIYYNRAALADVAQDIVKIADTEQLTAHANAIKVRF